MSSLSNQHSSNPFAEYGELCKVPVMSDARPAQPWDWQGMASPMGLMVSGPLPTEGLTDEDKLCFFERPVGGSGDLKVPSRMSGMSMSPSLGNASLGSAGESPDSLYSSPALVSSQAGSSPSPRGPTEGISPSESWDHSDFPQSSPKLAMPQVGSKYPQMECSREDLFGAESAGRVVEGSTGDNSEEEEEMDDEEEVGLGSVVSMCGGLM
ncbi:unnamed protein product [Knipowitschia caucasica]